jgi:hypothetical protein
MTRIGNLPAAISMWELRSVILCTAATWPMLSTAPGGTGHIIAVHGGERRAHLLQMHPSEYHKYIWAYSVSKCAYWPIGQWQKLALWRGTPVGTAGADGRPGDPRPSALLAPPAHGWPDPPAPDPLGAARLPRLRQLSPAPISFAAASDGTLVPPLRSEAVRLGPR